MTQFYASPQGEIIRDSGGNVETSTRKPLYYLDLTSQERIDILARAATDPVRIAYQAELAYSPSSPAEAGTTGTGTYVLAASPTLTGTLTATHVTASGVVRGSGAGGTTAYWHLQQGTAGASGLLAFYSVGAVRQGYIGNVSTTASADQGTINYSAATHAFIGAISATGGIGYAAGAGGAVTQTTSRTTGVTLNKVSGAITLVSAAGLATWQSFTVTNSTVAATDTVEICQKSGTDLHLVHVTAVAAGSFRVSFATTGGVTVEQPVFNFNVIKGVAA